MPQINASAENYLETILVIKNTKGSVRAIDIAQELAFSKPSVSIALKHLKESGHINVDTDGSITLTESGHQIAGKIYDRHITLTKFLTSLGVSKATAEQDACKIEHIISNETFESIKSHIYQ